MADLKQTLRSVYDAFNARDLDGLDERFHDDFVEYEEFPGIPTDRTAPRAMMEMLSQSFPDFAFNVEDVIQEGSKVMARGRMTGTHEGEFMGMPATGKRFDIAFMDLVEFRDDKAIAHWGITDGATMMEQLGAAD